MELEQVLQLLNKKLEDFRKNAQIRDFDGGVFRAWAQAVDAILIRGIGQPGRRLLLQFQKATWGLPMPDSVIDPGYQEAMFRERFESKLPEVEAALESIIWELETFGVPDASIQGEIRGEPPKAFIAHGGKSAARDKLEEFLRALGITPIIVEKEPSEGRLTEPQVDEYMHQADCEIILATYGHIVDTKTSKKHPRLNVIDELGRSREVFPGRTILLLEKGVELPSNVSGIVYERFTKQNVEKAFVKVARELRAFGLIKAVKPE